MDRGNHQHIDKDTRNKMFKIEKPIKVGDMVTIENNKVRHAHGFIGMSGIVVRVPTKDIIEQTLNELTDLPRNYITCDGYVIQTDSTTDLYGVRVYAPFMALPPKGVVKISEVI